MRKSDRVEAFSRERGWASLPKSVVSREGHKVDVSGLRWHMPTTSGRHAVCAFDRIQNAEFCYALMSYCMYVIKNISAAAGYAAYCSCWRHLLLVNGEFNSPNVDDFEGELIGVLKK
ncbi:hypothetical protein ACTHGN_004602 [Pseudomonas putida]